MNDGALARAQARRPLASSRTAAPKPTDRATAARDRLLAAANELFYREGVNSVGIDRVIEHAGVAKATLYSAFGSKNELIRAYLRARHTRTMERMVRELKRYETPRERLVGVFDVQGEAFSDPNFRGCAFVAANAESIPGEAVKEVTEEYRFWVRSLFYDLAVEAGARRPDELAHQLVLLYDGAGISAWLDRDATTASASRSVAAALVAAAID